MKRIVAFLVALFVLWLPFAVLALVAIPISLVAIVFNEMPYGKDVLRAMDKLGAAVLGWSGRNTISAECGAANCRFCKLICRMLDAIQRGHCEGAARREGLL